MKSELVGVILQQTHHIGKSTAVVFPAVIDCVSGVEREHWLYGLKNSMVCSSEGTTLTSFKMIRVHSKHHATHNHLLFYETVQLVFAKVSSFLRSVQTPFGRKRNGSFRFDIVY